MVDGIYLYKVKYLCVCYVMCVYEGMCYALNFQLNQELHEKNRRRRSKKQTFANNRRTNKQFAMNCICA